MEGDLPEIMLTAFLGGSLARLMACITLQIPEAAQQDGSRIEQHNYRMANASAGWRAWVATETEFMLNSTLVHSMCMCRCAIAMRVSYG